MEASLNDFWFQKVGKVERYARSLLVVDCAVRDLLFDRSQNAELVATWLICTSDGTCRHSPSNSSKGRM